MTLPLASVLIGTKDRSRELERCLHSLALSGWKEREIIVVDATQNPEEAARNARITENLGGAYLSRPGVGLSASRNLALDKSRREVVCFLDDDCVAGEGWLSFLVEALEEGGVAACTGRTLTDSGGEGEFLSLDKGPTPRIYGLRDVRVDARGLVKLALRAGVGLLGGEAPAPWSVGAGNNLAVKRRALESVGPFNEALGPGTPNRAGEDIDLFYRLLRGGLRIAYEPRAVLYHKPPQTQRNPPTTSLGYGLGMAAVVREHSPREPWLLIHLWGRLFQLGLRFGLATARNDGPGRGVLAAYGRGLIRGLLSPPRGVEG